MKPYLCAFQKIIPYILVVLITSACSIHHGRPKQAEFGAAWNSVSCKTFDVPDTISPNADCGYVTAPEQHAFPKGPTIQLAVVRVRSASHNPYRFIVRRTRRARRHHHRRVCQLGTANENPRLNEYIEERDLLFVEERGTKYSKPFLSCPEINAHNVAVAKGERAANY